MPAKKLLQDFEYILGEKIEGVSRERFDTSKPLEYLDVICKCGNTFKSRRQDLAARFKRGKNIKCINCVNRENVNVRYK
jgi:hypothetical protein